jgi:GT2 family glycosyltransferase
MTWDHRTTRQCDWVPGCFYLVRKEVIDQIGLFDPRFFFYCEEVDHCRRARDAGWIVTFYADTQVVHIGGESAKSDPAFTSSRRQIIPLLVESELLYYRKHHGLLGLIECVVLTAFGALMEVIKNAIHYKGRQRQVVQIEKLKLIWSLLRTTRFASQSTR